jgi:hypothetical protein
MDDIDKEFANALLELSQNRIMNEIAPKVLEAHNMSTAFSYRYAFLLGVETAIQSQLRQEGE